MTKEKKIDVKRTEIKTATVQIKTLVIDNRKFTLATFRQVPKKSLFATELKSALPFLRGDILGLVSYEKDPSYLYVDSKGILCKDWVRSIDEFKKASYKQLCLVVILECLDNPIDFKFIKKNNINVFDINEYREYDFRFFRQSTFNKYQTFQTSEKLDWNRLMDDLKQYDLWKKQSVLIEEKLSEIEDTLNNVQQLYIAT